MIKLLLVLLAKGGLGKLFITAGSMVLTMAVYASSYGWPYAVGLVLLLLVHEGGHFIAARQCGLRAGAPVFVPFVGAWITLDPAELTPEREAYVAIAGPMLGSIAAFGCYLLALDGQGRLWMALAQGGFLLNLFNLLPLGPLDGGRLAGVISPRLWLVGAPMLVALFFWWPSPMLVIVAILAAPQVLAALRGQVAGHATLASARDRWRYGAQYLALAGGLAVMAFQAHEWLAGGFAA